MIKFGACAGNPQDAIKNNRITPTSLLKAKLYENKMNYKDLSDKLKVIDINKSPNAIRQAIYKNDLSDEFFSKCVQILNMDENELNLIQGLWKKWQKWVFRPSQMVVSDKYFSLIIAIFGFEVVEKL